MSENTHREYDKSHWGPGPWDAEPDRVEFEHAGRPCLLVRNQLGVWCGYAAVDPGHPLYAINYSRCSKSECDGRYCEHAPSISLDVHGGLTYSDACQGAICHVPKPGEPDAVWWFGFDCGHVGDLTPSMKMFYERYADTCILADDTYRDVDYARVQTERLAEQLRDYPCAT